MVIWSLCKPMRTSRSVSKVSKRFSWKISWNLEGTRFGCRISTSLWNLTGVPVALSWHRVPQILKMSKTCNVRFCGYEISRDLISMGMGLTNCGIVTPYGDKICVNFGSGNDLLPDGTKPLSEPIFTYQRCNVAFTCDQFHTKCPLALSVIFPRLYF